MKQIRKVLGIRLRDPQVSIRSIAAATGCSRQVVKEYLDRLTAHPLRYEQLSIMNDHSLKAHLGIESPALQTTVQNQQLLIWLEQNIHRLNQKHMTRRLLHELYRETHSDGL